MKIEFIVLFVLSLIQFGVILWYIRKCDRHISAYTSHLLAKIMEQEKNTNTLGKVMKVFEDETQILRRKNETNTLKGRFSRQPR